MSDMKCPFCDSEIEQLNDQQRSLFHCSNIVCCKGGHYIGNISMWRDLIRTRKALDVAVDALKLFDSGQYTPQPDSYGLKTDASRLARKTLEQITAITKGDNNE